MTPTITALRAAPGPKLFATIDGQEVQLVTFRETAWKQGKVFVPPPFDERCEPYPILNDWRDDDSDLIEIEGTVHNLEAARLVEKWAAGNLANGTYRVN